MDAHGQFADAGAVFNRRLAGGAFYLPSGNGLAASIAGAAWSWSYFPSNVVLTSVARGRDVLRGWVPGGADRGRDDGTGHWTGDLSGGGTGSLG